MNGIWALAALGIVTGCVQADLRGGLNGRTALACEEYAQTLRDLTAYRKHGLMSAAQVEEVNGLRKSFRICEDRDPRPDIGTVERMESDLRELQRLQRKVIG